MLTLIRREIQDHVAYLVLGGLLAALMVTGLVVQALVRDGATVVICLPLLILALFGFCVMGAAQMYSDCAGRISSFLSTLAVTRGQILIARFFVGVLTILLTIVPPAIAGVIVLQELVPPFAFYSHFVARVYATVLLVALSSYCFGLRIGWNTGKFIRLFGMILLPAILLSLVSIKGFSVDAIVLLAILTAALTVSVTMKFCSTPL